MTITAYPYGPANNEYSGIAFSCTRQDKRTPDMKKLYQDIIAENAHSHLTQVAWCPSDPNRCSPNQRGDLHECGCQMLASNTSEGNAARVYYRNKIIQTALPLINQDPHEPVKIGFFGSGGLYGEVTTILRLAHALKNKGFKGELRCFFVDPCYAQGIQDSRQSEVLDIAVGQQKQVAQFIRELSSCLPKAITVTGVFFKSIEDYQTAAQQNAWFKHDLFTGADTEHHSYRLETVKKLAGSTRALNPIVLLKGDQPLYCTVEGEKHDCITQDSHRITIPNAVLKKRDAPEACLAANKKDSEFNLNVWKIVLIVIFVVAAVFLGYLVLREFSNRSNRTRSTFQVE